MYELVVGQIMTEPNSVDVKENCVAAVEIC